MAVTHMTIGLPTDCAHHSLGRLTQLPKGRASYITPFLPIRSQISAIIPASFPVSISVHNAAELHIAAMKGAGKALDHVIHVATPIRRP